MRSSRLLSFCMLAMLLIGIANAAHAQMASGGFTLANETHWGKYDLPAGEYTFSLSSASVPASVTVRDNSGTVVALIPAQTLSCIASSDGSRLLVTHKGADTVVTSLQVGEIGLVLNYGETGTTQETQQSTAAMMLKKPIPIHLH